MLLQALHRYATEHSLLDRLPFQVRTVHWLIPLTSAGQLRGSGLVPLTTTVTKGERIKEEPGRALLLPRFPGEKNQGKASYLADPFDVVLGLNRQTGKPLPVEDKGKERDAVRAHRMFWRWIEEAHKRLGDSRLASLLAFRQRYLPEQNGYLAPQFDFIEMRVNPKSKKQEPELMARTNAGGWIPLAKANTVSFEVDGSPLAVLNLEDSPTAEDSPLKELWQDWERTFLEETFTEAEEGEQTANVERAATLCLITGEVGHPVARSHKPEIKGIPGLPPKGASFFSAAKAAPAFSSYGFIMGENAPVSERAAAAYSLALNELLASNDSSLRVGEVMLCFWAEKQRRPTALTFRNLSTANPRSVAEFLKQPFAGVKRELAKADQFLSVALAANAGRVVVRDWVRLPLEQAVLHLHEWFQDLEIDHLAGPTEEAPGGEDKAGPCSLFRLAAALVRDSKELKQRNEMVSELYQAALRGRPPEGPRLLHLLEPVLREFRSALVTDSPKKPRYPFNPSRFALIKLILVRNAEGGFMPSPHLADTDDSAYNLGRLLCILSSLQDQAHEYKLEGPGIVERYYGSASAAPAGVYAVLWRLHNHHLRKLEQKGDKGTRAAAAIRARIAEVVSKFPAPGPGQPPQFPRQLSLEEQGRFALGFYQQMAADRKAIRDAKRDPDA